MELFLKDRDYYEKLFLCNQTKRARSCVVVCACVVIHQLSANAHQFGAEDAINWAQDFYRGQRPCSSIERKYFGQLHVEVPFKVSLKSH